MSANVYYHATLALDANLDIKEDKKRGGKKVSIEVGGKPFPILVKRNMVALLEENPPEGEQSLILWPRTDKEGLLGNGTQLGTFRPAGTIKREHNLHAVGELVKVDRENALLQIEIFPNPNQGSLRKSFKLPLVASLEVLDTLPELGSGLEVWADLKSRTGRVVVTKVQAHPLPPKGEPKEKPGTEKTQVETKEATD